MGEWKPPLDLPDLSNIHSIGFDTEHPPLSKHVAKPCGFSFKTPAGKYYLPFGHEGGGNLDPEKIHRWAKHELRGKRIVGLNIGNDSEVMRNWGVDLEAQGCTLHDIAHSAALLNEYRRKGFSLDALGHEYIGRGKKNLNLDKDTIHLQHSSVIGEYAEDDAEIAYDVDEVQQKQIQEEDLGRVQDLEDRLIWCNNHIERNGARIDREKLKEWSDKTAMLQGDILFSMWKENPNLGRMKLTSAGWSRLFGYLGIDNPNRTAKGAPSFTADYLKTVKHPLVWRAMRANKIKSFRAKFVQNYLERIGAGDILRFQLYQLRSQDNEEDDGANGTVSGRYSSANVNIQQVAQVEKQEKEMKDLLKSDFRGTLPDYVAELFMEEFILREVFIPDDGFEYFSGDASQIEFRLFAHYSGSHRLQKQYNDNPKIDFHQLVADMLGQERHEAKHNNFGVLYGMGLPKLARRLGWECNCGVTLECACEFGPGHWEHDPYCGRQRDAHSEGCPAILAIEAVAKYNDKFPEAKKLLKKVSRVAEERGYIRTILGRRQRYNGTKLHSFLNRLIQGTAADVFKLKLLQLYENRNTVGIHKLRQPVHDEATGDCVADPVLKSRLHELFMEPVIECKVPILWEVGTGANWKEAKAK